MKNRIIDYLNEVVPNPRCELNYNKDYELLIATMLSAQTTDKRVNEITAILFNKYSDLKSLSEALETDLIEIVRPLGNYHKKAYNIKAIAKSLYDAGGVVPNDRLFLEGLSGVGRKTTNVVLSNIYDEPLLAVDTHIERVSKRLGLAEPDDNVRIVEDKVTNYFKDYNLCRLHHQLLLFGRYHCKAVNPNCNNCKLKDICKKDII
ncbi:MAG: endonuclease III [Bacilli bacterium]|nr:endonuclease III [Bacilli bacterium]